MARVGSGDSFDIAVWTQGEHPGAGTQDFTDFNDKGLGGNFKRLWRAIKTVLAYDGSLNTNIVDGANLKSTVADGVTMEQDSVTKKLQVKAGGIGTTQLAADAVTKEKVDAGVAGAGMVQNVDGSLSPKVDGVTVHLNASNELEIVGDGLARLRQIYSSQAVAAVTAGATPTELEWAETSNVPVDKIYSWTKLHTADSNLYVHFLAKSDSATYMSKVRVDVYDAMFGIAGGSLAGDEITFDNLTYDGALITIDLTGISLPVGSSQIMVVVKLASGKNGTNTGTMKDVSITIGD